MADQDKNVVRYSVDGSNYDIPVDKVQDFERDVPNARQVYRVGEDVYAIPLGEREGFQSQYPNASLWNDTAESVEQSEPQQKAEWPKQTPWSEKPDYWPETTQQPQQTQHQEGQKQGFWARLGGNLAAAESSPQGMSMPEQPAPQPEEKKTLPEDWEQRSSKFDSEYSTVSGVISAKLAEKDDALKQRAIEREKGMGKFLSGFVNAGQAEGGAITPQAREEIAAGGDPESDQLRAAANLLDQAKRIKDAAYKQKGVLGGLADSATVDTWDFGVTDLKTAQQVYKLAQKLETNEDLTENDNLLLEALMQNAASNEYYRGHLSRGYKAGEVTGTSLPFMLEFIMNPLAGGERAAQGGAIKVLEKRLANMLTKRAEKAAAENAAKVVVKSGLEKAVTTAAKGAARGIDDLISAAGMAATTGSIRTLEDAYNRKTGDVQFHEDEDGGLVFDGFGNGEDQWWKAAAKAYGATTIDDFSEMFGNYFRPIGNVGKKGLYFINRKIGLEKVNSLIDGIGAKEWAKAASEFLKRTDWNGPIGEFGEEVVGGVLNALTIGDQKLKASDPNGVFNKDNLIDTFLGVALFGGFVSAMKTAGYSRQVQRNAERREEIILEGSPLFEEKQWQQIRQQIDNADAQTVDDLIKKEFGSESEFTPEQRKVIGEYAGVRMNELGMERGIVKKEEYVAEGLEEGRTASTPEEYNRQAVDSEYANAKAASEAAIDGEPSADTELGVERSNAVMAGRREAELANLNARIGKPFWREVEKPLEDGQTPSTEQMVDIIRYADGREVYIITEDNGMLATLDSDGNTGFMTKGDLEQQEKSGDAVHISTPLQAYLDGRVTAQNVASEQQRMAQDAANNLRAVQQRVQREGRINVGTPESEVWATVLNMNAAPNGGVVIQVEGQKEPMTMTWQEVASAYGAPLEPKTNTDIVEKRIFDEQTVKEYNSTIPQGSELFVPYEGIEQPSIYRYQGAELVEGSVVIRAEDAVTGEVVDLVPEMVSNLDGLLHPVEAASETDAAPMPTANAEAPMPTTIFDDPAANELGISKDYAYTTKNGRTVVDGGKLWSDNPKLWAKWNDANPNRVMPTKDFLASKLADMDADVSKARADLEMEQKGKQNPDMMEELMGILQEKEARQQLIQNLYNEYEVAEQAAIEAAKEQVRTAENANKQQSAQSGQQNQQQEMAPSVEGQSLTAEEILSDAQKTLDELKAQLSEAENDEERQLIMDAKAIVLQQMLDALGAENTVVSTRADIVEVFRAAGGSEANARALAEKLRLTAGKERLRGFYNNGKIFIIADDIRGAEDANVAQLHEAKHLENAATGAVNEGMRTGVTTDEMRTAIRILTRSNSYDEESRRALADEVLANAEEIAEREGVEAIPQRLAEAGIVNGEFINFVQNNINNGRRGSQRRHLGGRHALQSVDSEVSGREDVRDTQPQPAAVEGQGLRPDAGGEQGAGGREAAEPAGESGGLNQSVIGEPEIGDFGVILRGYEGKPKEAIQRLIELQEGEAIGALSHPEIGPIDLVWGEEGTGHSDGFGLAKLVKYHPEVVENLQGLLDDMSVTDRSENRIHLESEKYQAIVRLTWDDKRKTWLLSAFEKKNSALDNTTDTGETLAGERNDTATPQDTVSENKDNNISQTENKNLTESQKKALAFVEGKTPEQIEQEYGAQQNPAEDDDIKPSIVGGFSSAVADLEKDGISVNNKDLLDEYNLSDVTLTKKDDLVTLNKIVVKEKGQGNGTRFMNDLVFEADNKGWTLALTPDDSFGATSVGRLKGFYKQFGFKPNKGQNTDFTINESMVRRPLTENTRALNEKGLAANNEEVRWSVRYAPSEEEAGKVSADISKETGVSRVKAKQWVRSETSLAAIILDEYNQPYLDYIGDDRYTAIKTDSDYPQGTVDFNNICRKRIPFTDMYQRIQRAFPNTVITGKDLATIRQIMKDHGITVACGLCYVEDRRQLLGEIANGFIHDLRDNFNGYSERKGFLDKPNDKGDVETRRKVAVEIRNIIGEDAKDDLSIYDLLTLSGAKKLSDEHPGLYNAFQRYNSARGQQAGNLFQGYAEYKREILKWSPAKVRSVNRHGGLRIFSYSDFEAHHLIDLVQIIQDAARKGVMIQGYTKVPAFARAIANTGVKLNRSLIPLGDTGIVDGKLAYDPVEGIDINDPNFIESNDNVGNILIGINDEQIRLAMQDSFVHFIIPYHSNQKDLLRQMKQTGAWTNYKNEQVDKGGKEVNIYTDVLAAAAEDGKPIKNEKQFVEKFLSVCKERGLTPRFWRFLNTNENGEYIYTPGYYKLLLDFKLFNENGRILPQKPVVAQFDDAFNAKILQDYVAGEKGEQNADLDAIYDEIVDKLGLGKSDMRFSVEKEKSAGQLEGESESNPRSPIADFTTKIDNLLQKARKDADYLMAVEAGDMEKAQQMVDEAAKAAGYGIKAYHGTARADRVGNVFRPERATSGPMAFFSESKEVAQGYSKGKNDTSIAYDSDYFSYETQFRTRDKKTGDDISVYDVWNKLSAKDRANIAERAKHLREDYDTGDVVYDESTTNANGGWDYQVKDYRGDIMKALNYQWLSSGQLYGNEGKYLKVLEMAGVNDALENAGFEAPRYMDPEYREEAVYNVYLKIQNPFDTKNVNEEFIEDFEEYAAEHEAEYTELTANADYWDKNNFSAEEFAQNMRDDIKNNTTFAWTSIPDIMSDYLKSLGYDGIKDAGGKFGGEQHAVWVPFESEQVKSSEPVTRDNNGNVVPLSERFNPENEDIRFSLRGIIGAAEDEVAMQNLGIAEQMEEDGKDAKTIWLATGWEKGADGKWKNEIPDATPKKLESLKKVKTVGDLIDAPELFASYPGMRNYKVNIKKHNAAGSFNDDTKILTLDKDFNFSNVVPKENEEPARRETVEFIGGRSSIPQKEVDDFKKYLYEKYGDLQLDNTGMRTIMHELQHAVQNIEGFAKGGNSQKEGALYMESMYKQNPPLVSFARVYSARNAASRLINYGREKMLGNIERNIESGEFSGEAERRLTELRDYIATLNDVQYNKFVRDADKVWKSKSVVGKENYRNLAGEVEARNVESRFGMSQEDRRNTPPSETESVPRKDQGIRFSTVMDANSEYRDAVESGDTQMVKQMVLDSAKKAMPNTKVVDKNGYPKVVYHGTPFSGQITSFYTDEVYLTTKPDIADQYTHYRRDLWVSPKQTGRVMPVFVDIEKPLEIDANRHLWNNIQVDWSDTPVSTQDIAKYASENGYDGAIIKKVRDNMWNNDNRYSDVIIALSPSQVKSAGATYEKEKRWHFPWDEYDKLTNEVGATYDDEGNLIPLSDRFNRATDDIRFSVANTNQDIFISNAENAVRNIQQGKATPEQWLKMLEKNGGLKAGEDKWLGLSQWLKDSDKKSLTKAEIEAYIAENKIKIEETNYAENVEKDYAEAIKSYQDEYEELVEEGRKTLPPYESAYDYAFDKMIDRYGDDFDMAFMQDGDSISPTEDWDREDDLSKAAINYLDQRRKGSVERIDPVRLGYTTEGLDGKREIALTVPTIEPWNTGDKIHFGEAGEGRAIAWIRFGDTTVSTEREKAVEKANDAQQKWRDYKDELNEKYALRATETKPVKDLATDEENEKLKELYVKWQGLKADIQTASRNRERVLVIDEIQSKRHQEAREKGGYTDRAAAKKAKENQHNARVNYYNLTKSLMSKYGVEDKGEAEPVVWHKLGQAGATKEEIDQVHSLYEAWGEASREYNRVSDSNGIPAAPFEKNWHELAMKRMLRLAAEEGYDYIAWTTGEQQTERYNIGNVVKDIEKRDGKIYIDLDDDSAITLRVDKEGDIYESSGAHIQPGEYNGKNIGDIVGKEVAVKVMQAEDGTVLRGDDLRIGGEGMKGFYDEILPRFMNKYGKQWGVKVEDINLPWVGEDGLTMHSVPVTQEMKDSVMEGQLMFSVVGQEKIDEEQRPRIIEKAEKGGLAAVIGEENVQPMYRGIYSVIPENVLRPIVEAGLNDGGDIKKHFRQYLHNLAAAGTENDETGLLFAICDEIRSDTGNYALTDDDIRYMLWRDTADTQEGDILALAERQAMKNRWGVGDPLRFSAQGEFVDATSGAVEDSDQRIIAANYHLKKDKAAAKNEASPARAIAKAMAAQKTYDKATVDNIVRFAKEILKNGRVDDLTLREVSRLLTLVNNATAKSPKFATRYADQLMDLLLDHIVDNEYDKMMKLVNVKDKTLAQSGVEKQGKLDVLGQITMKAFRDNMHSSIAEIDRRILELSDRINDPDKAVRDEAFAERQGLKLAIEYNESIVYNDEDLKDLKSDLKTARREDGMSREAFDQYKKSLQQSITDNRLMQVDNYREFTAKLAEIINGSSEKAAAFREAEKQRVEDIHHDANRDMQGVPAKAHLRDTALQRFNNSDIVRFFFKPLASFDQMTRVFGRKNARGEGYIWNRMMRDGWQKSTERKYQGIKEATEILDKKASDVFGKKMIWSDLYKEERGKPQMDVDIFDDGEMRRVTLTQGNMLYIYMANKMTDGKMKLRKMGITEEDVEAIKSQIDPRFIELADWLQDEFYVELRNKMNEVHERMFGAPMAAIEDYVPLKILSNARIEDVDLGNKTGSGELSSTITGSIIKRRKNSLALDILHTDAFSLAIEHVEQMEDWAAFAEFRRDMNTLLSYKRFRNQVMNMDTIYGSGKDLWNNFVDAATIAVGKYQPKVKRGDVDKMAVNVAKGVTAAKIAFRVNTAVKQLLSFPAYLSEARADYLAKSMVTPGASWKWCMENLPVFQHRWQSRIAGDTRLMQTDSDWAVWKNSVVEKAGRLGLTPNAFVDAVTVAVGTKAIYDTKYAQYKNSGYSDEKADEMAKQDATIAYNQTQQSEEGAFVSPIQLDRTFLSVTLSTYRNSSMSYQRQLHDAIRAIGRMMKPGYRQQSIDFMTRQNINNGLDEDMARAAAERDYRRQIGRNAVRVAVFGYGLQLLWKLGSDMWYLLLGDDDDKKKKIFDEAALTELAAPVEGLTGGQGISDIVGNKVKKTVNERYGIKNTSRGGTGLDVQLPALSDLNDLISEMEYDEVRAWSDIVDLVAQSGFGVNPRTFTDAIVAINDACNGDLDTAREIAFLMMRIGQVPQSTIDEFWIDEIDMTAADARKLSTEQLAERYARYKFLKDSPYTYWLYSEEDKAKKLKKYEDRFKKKVKERMALKEPADVPETPEETYKNIEKEMKAFQGQLNTAVKANDIVTEEILKGQPDYQRYLIWKRHQKGINALTKKIKNTQDDALREQWTKDLRDSIQVEINELSEIK